MMTNHWNLGVHDFWILIFTVMNFCRGNQRGFTWFFERSLVGPWLINDGWWTASKYWLLVWYIYPYLSNDIDIYNQPSLILVFMNGWFSSCFTAPLFCCWNPQNWSSLPCRRLVLPAATERLTKGSLDGSNGHLNPITLILNTLRKMGLTSNCVVNSHF